MPTESPSPKAPLIQRMPTALFIVGYGVLAIALIVTVILLVAHSTKRTQASPQLRTVAYKSEEHTVDLTQIQASIRPHLISDAQTGQNYDGAMLRGTITDYATLAPEEFAGHATRLLEQNCIPGVVLTTTDNMHLNFWGFCHSAPTTETVVEVAEFAREHEADFVSFYLYPGPNNDQRATLTWATEQSEADVEKLTKEWEKLSRPEGLKHTTYEAFTDEKAIVMDVDTKRGTSLSQFPRPHQD